MLAAIQVILLLTLGLAIVYVSYGLVIGAKVFLKWRGKRLVRCPETLKPAAVDIDSVRAAREAVFGQPKLQLSQCSRWPERADCGQECLEQVESAPEDCLVRNVIRKFYEGKKCAFCGREIHEAEWLGHRPALATADKQPLAWESIPPESVPEALVANLPICWDCYIAETFRREHAELVTDRKAH